MKNKQWIFNGLLVVLLAVVCFSVGTAYQVPAPPPPAKVSIADPKFQLYARVSANGALGTTIVGRAGTANATSAIDVNPDGSLNVQVKNPNLGETGYLLPGQVSKDLRFPKTLTICGKWAGLSEVQQSMTGKPSDGGSPSEWFPAATTSNTPLAAMSNGCVALVPTRFIENAGGDTRFWFQASY